MESTSLNQSRIKLLCCAVTLAQSTLAQYAK
jgi:hypothetical protein